MHAFFNIPLAKVYAQNAVDLFLCIQSYNSGSNTPSLVSSLAVGPSAVVPSPTAVSSETSHQLSPTTMAAIIVPILIVVIAVLIIITVIVAVVALKFLK